MAQSVPQPKVVDQGPWWLLAIAVPTSFAMTVMSVNTVVASPTLTNQLVVGADIVLTVWFAIGISFSAIHHPAPPMRIFLILLFIVFLIAGFAMISGQLLAIVPCAIALIGFITNLRKL